MHTVALAIIAIALIPLAFQVLFRIVIPSLFLIAVLLASLLLTIAYWKQITILAAALIGLLAIVYIFQIFHEKFPIAGGAVLKSLNLFGRGMALFLSGFFCVAAVVIVYSSLEKGEWQYSFVALAPLLLALNFYIGFRDGK